MRQFPTHHVLIREGEKARDVILLRQAYVKVTAGVGGSREALIDIRASGDVVGEVAALDGSPRSATVTTCGSALVSTITADDFAAFLFRHPDAGLALSRRLASRLRFATRRRTDFSSYRVSVRLARVLVEVADAYGYESADGVRLAVPLTQEELGALAGAAADSVYRELRVLAEQSIVETKYRNIVIRDLARLRRRALGAGGSSEKPENNEISG
jgi:CRP/FNR family transcriptional regulator, cyclic AMP receptor protein